MASPKKASADPNPEKSSSAMPFQKKEPDGRGTAGSSKTQNGKPAFRTDTDISVRRAGGDRKLQRFQFDEAANKDMMGLEQTSRNGTGNWDQFSENEKRFGLTTDYHENYYTTAIDKAHPQYRERVANADRLAREIEGSAAATAHVEEERIMNHNSAAADGVDEEEKYSGVRRSAVLSGPSTQKYTPPARRAPTGQATVVGAPVDPAIISSQLKNAASKDKSTNKENKTPAVNDSKSPAAAPSLVEPDAKPSAASESLGSGIDAASKVDASAKDKTNRSTSTAAGVAFPAPTLAPSNTLNAHARGMPRNSATSTVERDVLNSFKSFASSERARQEESKAKQKAKQKADHAVKLADLKRFSENFKLQTPIPHDLISIIAKDPDKQAAIQAKALESAEVAKAQAAVKEQETLAAKDTKATADTTAPLVPAGVPADSRAYGRQQSSQPHVPGNNGRQPGGRQSYGPQQYHGYRGDRSGSQGYQQNRQTGNLAQRLRQYEQQRTGMPPGPAGPPPLLPTLGVQDVRVPPTGPAGGADAPYNRRLSAVPPPAHLSGPPKLNPNSHEFRPGLYAGPSFHPVPAFNNAGASPRALAADPTYSAVASKPAPRRKTKAVSAAKCHIMTWVKTLPPPQGRNYNDNLGIRPSYDTPPTWKQPPEDALSTPAPDVIMDYVDFYDRIPFPFGSNSASTPTPQVSVPLSHQLPYHLQHGAHGMVPSVRQSPQVPPVPMQTAGPQHMPGQPPFPNGADEHRMMHSSSSQSYASPRMVAGVPAGFPPSMNGSPAVPPFGQQGVPHYMPGAPHMQGFRSFSNAPQYMPQPSGPMQGQMMGFFPPGMVVGGPPVFPPQPGYMPPPVGGPPQAMPPSSSGYPSPVRPQASMMVPQGSQQGQPPPMYGMSPSMQYQQPAFSSQPPPPIPPSGSGKYHKGMSGGRRY